jgi:hypothetical protein
MRGKVLAVQTDHRIEFVQTLRQIGQKRMTSALS